MRIEKPDLSVGFSYFFRQIRSCQTDIMFEALLFGLGAILGNIVTLNKARKATSELWDAVTPAEASLIAEFRREIATKSSQNIHLKLINRGKVAAHRIRVEIDGVDIENHQRFSRSRPQETVNELKLEPGSSITRRYRSSLDTSLREHNIRIFWEDPSGYGKWESTQSQVKPCG